MKTKFLKMIIALAIVMPMFPAFQTKAYFDPYLFYIDNEDKDVGEISGTISAYVKSDFYFIDENNQIISKVPTQKSENGYSLFIPMNTKIPPNALRIGAFGTENYNEGDLLGYAPIFDGPVTNYVDDATFYDTDPDQNEYGGYIEWIGPEYKGNLHDFEISLNFGDQTGDVSFAVVPVIEGTKYRFAIPPNTKIERLREATIYGRNKLGDSTPNGMIVTMPDRYDWKVSSKDIPDLAERLSLNLRNISQSNFLWVSAFSMEGTQTIQNDSFIALLDKNENVVDFVGEVNEMNFVYKFPKDYQFPAQAKYIGVYWKSINNWEIIGKSIQPLPSNLVLSGENSVEKSPALQSNQVIIKPAGANKYFVHLNGLVKESEIKIYDRHQNLIVSEIADSNIYSKLLTLDNISTNELKFGIVEKDKQESDLLSLPIQLNGWIYFKEETNVPTTKEWNIKFTTSVNTQDLISNNMYILDAKGVKVPVKISSNESKTVVTLRPETPFKNGETYYLYVENNVRSQSGKTLSQGYVKVFTTTP